MSATKAVLALCIIFYLANLASSLKCYNCNGDDSTDCWSNPAQSKYEQTCPGSSSVGSDSTLPVLEDSASQSALANISALIASELSTVPRAPYDPECLKLTGSLKGTKGVIRLCIIKGMTDAQIIAAASPLTDITLKRCDSNLCNSSGTLSISFLSLVSCLLLMFSVKL